MVWFLFCLRKKSKSSTSASVKKSSFGTNADDRASSREKEDEREYESLLSKSLDEENATTPSGRKMTEAERKFEEVRRKRVSTETDQNQYHRPLRVIENAEDHLLPSQMHERIRKEAKLSHKEKVDAFNQYLGSLSEHHDIPKVGPG